VLLCASKDDEVVEYALSRSLSPALIAEYQTQPAGQEDAEGKAPRILLAEQPGRCVDASGVPQLRGIFLANNKGERQTSVQKEEEFKQAGLS
jgi:hypothetical protein